MPFYRKRPVVIEAVQFDGDNFEEVLELLGEIVINTGDNTLSISTLEGDMRANIGDWIIKGVASEGYPCRNDVFLRTYEPA